MRDQEITELFWERKEQAVTESNIRYGAYCRRISYNILANKEDVEECMNDTWYQAWNAIPPQRPLCLKAFFGKIIRNLSLNRWKWDRAGKRIRPEAMLGVNSQRTWYSQRNSKKKLTDFCMDFPLVNKACLFNDIFIWSQLKALRDIMALPKMQFR